MTDSDACVRFDPENKPGVSNLMQIYSVATGKRLRRPSRRNLPVRATASFKTAVGESVVELLRPIREETERLLADKAYLESVYRAGAEKACLCSQPHPVQGLQKGGLPGPVTAEET